MSFKSARYLQRAREESHRTRYTYYYGFQVIYGGINKFMLLIILGSILGILPQTLIVTLSFIMLRVWAGGLHFDSYTACAYVSLLLLLSMGLMVKYMSFNQNIIIIIFSTIFAIFAIFAPIEHKNRLFKQGDKIKFKLIALSSLLVLYFSQHILTMDLWRNSIMCGSILAGLIALPIFNRD